MRGRHVAVASALAVVGGLVFAAPASAHHPEITAEARCGGAVSFTVTAWAGRAGDPGSRTNSSIEVAVSIDGSDFVPLPAKPGHELTAANASSFSDEVVLSAPPATSVRLRVRATAPWGNGVVDAGERTTEELLLPDCGPPRPPPPATDEEPPATDEGRPKPPDEGRPKPPATIPPPLDDPDPAPGGEGGQDDDVEEAGEDEVGDQAGDDQAGDDQAGGGGNDDENEVALDGTPTASSSDPEGETNMMVAVAPWLAGAAMAGAGALGGRHALRRRSAAASRRRRSLELPPL